MSYKVTLFNYYETGERDFVQFDTNSVMLHEAWKQANHTMYQQRQIIGQDPEVKPDKQVFYAWPTLGYGR